MESPGEPRTRCQGTPAWQLSISGNKKRTLIWQMRVRGFGEDNRDQGMRARTRWGDLSSRAPPLVILLSVPTEHDDDEGVKDWGVSGSLGIRERGCGAVSHGAVSHGSGQGSKFLGRPGIGGGAIRVSHRPHHLLHCPPSTLKALSGTQVWLAVDRGVEG